MRASDRSEIAVAVAMLLAVWTVTPLTLDRSFLVLSTVLIAVLTTVTIGLRRAQLSSSSVFAFQVLIVAVFSVALSLTLSSRTTPVLEHYPSLWAEGVRHMQTQASPMDPHGGVTLIFVTCIGVLTVLTELLAVGVARPAWAIAPPATLFLIPALGLGLDSGVLSFVLIAVGYVGILVADGLNSSARWTRGLSRDSADGQGSATSVVWRAAAVLTIPALVGSILLSVALPTLSLPGIGIGSGGSGRGPLQLTDPSLDLRRNLNQPTDREVITYQTNAPGGVYLRLASLTQLSRAGFANVQIRLTEGDTLPDVPGLTTEPATVRTTTVSVQDFGSQYLPLPYAPRRFEAAGDWSYDPQSLIVLNRSSRPSDLRNLTYRAESVDISPDPAGLDQASVGRPQDDGLTAKVPEDLPRSIVRLTEDVVDKADSPAAKAIAIQAYLRSDEFEYSVKPQAGSGYQALENFLLNDKLGYCEQFAAAMAVMARVAGIPSRVSVGFLPGRRDGDIWRVGIRDMHAWPELYFAGYGWVRFEPTPANVTGAAPNWTVPVDEPENEATPSASAQPSADEATPSAAPSTAPSEQPGADDGASAFPWGKTLLGTLGGLLVLLILAAPATIRVRRRHARLRDPDPDRPPVEAAWAEIRDSVVDYGGSWPEGSPRAIGSQIGERLEEPDSESMARVATLVERARYAKTAPDNPVSGELATMADQIRRGLAAPAGRMRKIRATLWPTSVFRRRRTRP